MRVPSTLHSIQHLTHSYHIRVNFLKTHIFPSKVLGQSIKEGQNGFHYGQEVTYKTTNKLVVQEWSSHSLSIILSLNFFFYFFKKKKIPPYSKLDKKKFLLHVLSFLNYIRPDSCLTRYVGNSVLGFSLFTVSK